MEEQAAYLQQLKAEANLNPNDPKEKLLLELTDTVSLLCHQIYRVNAVNDGYNETLEIIREQLDMLFEEEPQEEPEEYYDGQERTMYEVRCPQCGDRFAVDETTLAKGFACPNCGTHLIGSE